MSGKEKAFIEYLWGRASAPKVLKLSRVDVLRNAAILVADGPDAAPGESEMERAAWRAATKRGVRKLRGEERE